MPWRQHLGTEEKSTNCTDCTLSWEKDTILYCMYSMARQHSGTNCINCTLSSQWISKQTYAVSRSNSSQTMLEGVFYDLQCISGRQQWGQFGVAVYYSRANNIHSVWVRCPGMMAPVPHPACCISLHVLSTCLHNIFLCIYYNALFGYCWYLTDQV